MNSRGFLVLCGSTLVSLLGPKISAGEVAVPAPPRYSYDDEKVYQLKVRGSYGRYITFVGRTTNQYSGTPSYYNPGSPGTLNCATNLYGTYGSTNCYRTGYVAPSYRAGTAAGTQQGQFRYELDCQDMTFDRKGDRLSGSSMKGWMDVSDDPTAAAVAKRFCPQASTLPKVYYLNGKYIIDDTDTSRKARLVAFAMAKSHCLQEEQGVNPDKAFQAAVSALLKSGINVKEAVRLIKQDAGYSTELRRFKSALDKSTCELNDARLLRSF